MPTIEAGDLTIEANGANVRFRMALQCLADDGVTVVRETEEHIELAAEKADTEARAIAHFTARAEAMLKDVLKAQDLGTRFARVEEDVKTAVRAIDPKELVEGAAR